MTEVQPAGGSGGVIPTEQALEIRRLTHDLSNALEIVIQTSYLLGMLELDADSKQWVQMLDTAVRKAVDLNGELRTYIQANSAQANSTQANSLAAKRGESGS